MPESYVMKVRGGSDTYVRQDGKVGTGGKGALIEKEVTFTVAATQDQTLVTGDGDYVVRRLTPMECERLQGMPDGHTNLKGCDVDAVTERVAASLGYDEEKQRAALRRKVTRWSKETPDGPRYKAVGNSMCVNVMRWIGERLLLVDGILKEQSPTGG